MLTVQGYSKNVDLDDTSGQLKLEGRMYIFYFLNQFIDEA